MDRRKYLGFIVFPAGIAAMMAFLFFVAKVDIFRERTVEQSVAELRTAEDSALRWKAAADLKRRKDPAGVPALREALEDKNPAVRWHAADALAAIVSGTAVPDLLPLLADESEDVRRVAAFLLGEVGDARAREPLRLAVEDKVEVVRWNAAVALSRLGDRSAVPTLHDMLRAPTPRSIGGAVKTIVPGQEMPAPEPDRQVHANALLALALVGGPESVRPIEAFIEADVEPDLAPLARKVVEKIKSLNPKPTE